MLITRNYRPRSISAVARLSECQHLLRDLRDRRFTDEAIAAWLRTDPANIAQWRDGSAVPGAGVLASLRRLARESARHV